MPAASGYGEMRVWVGKGFNVHLLHISPVFLFLPFFSRIHQVGPLYIAYRFPQMFPAPIPSPTNPTMYPLPPLPDPINYLVPVILCICVHPLLIHYKSTQVLPASTSTPCLFSQVQQVPHTRFISHKPTLLLFGFDSGAYPQNADVVKFQMSL